MEEGTGLGPMDGSVGAVLCCAVLCGCMREKHEKGMGVYSTR